MTKVDLQHPGHDAESLLLEVESLKAKFADTAAVLPPEWKLTVVEDRIFRVLLICDCATRDAISTGAGVSATRTIDVHLVRIRKKTARFGVEIETVRSRGWRLVNRFSWSRSLAPIAPKGE